MQVKHLKIRLKIFFLFLSENMRNVIQCTLPIADMCQDWYIHYNSSSAGLVHSLQLPQCRTVTFASIVRIFWFHHKIWVNCNKKLGKEFSQNWLLFEL